MAIKTHPELRARGLFWKREEAPTGRWASFSHAALHGRAYHLVRKSDGALVAFTSVLTEGNEERYVWLFRRGGDQKTLRSKGRFLNHMEAKLSAELFIAQYLRNAEEAA